MKQIAIKDDVNFQFVQNGKALKFGTLLNVSLSSFKAFQSQNQSFDSSGSCEKLSVG